MKSKARYGSQFAQRFAHVSLAAMRRSLRLSLGCSSSKCQICCHGLCACIPHRQCHNCLELQSSIINQQAPRTSQEKTIQQQQQQARREAEGRARVEEERKAAQAAAEVARQAQAKAAGVKTEAQKATEERAKFQAGLKIWSERDS